MKCRPLFLLIVLSQIGYANRRVSVADLEQMVAAERTAHTADAECAKRLEGLELTERLTEHSLQRILAANSPGPQTTQALDLLEDTSAFLDPPPSELPQQPAPDFKTQKSMVSAAIDFVAVTLQHLPDFIVTRSTQSFDNVSTQVSQSRELLITRMHVVDALDRQITYRNGREVMDTAENGKPKKATAGMQTWGEFGPVLATILTDAVKGHVVWSHWETGTDAKPVAVFHYSVPRSASHYLLNYCCTNNLSFFSPNGDYRDTPAYHGSLYLNPDDGTVRRVTLEADTSATDTVDRAAIAVEYGPVEIGGKTYTCPQHSLAFSADHYHPGTRLIGLGAITRINEVRFVNYHKFGSSSRILADAGQNGPPVASSNEQQNARPAVPAPPTVGLADLGENSIATAPAPKPQQAAPASPAPEPHPAAVIDADVQAALRQMPVIKTQTQDVLVDVVVTAKDGKPVLNLARADFAVGEDGKPQSIDFFEEHGTAQAGSKPPEPMPPLPSGAYTNVPPSPPGDSVNVILLDMLNTSPRSQVYVREKLNTFFKKMDPGVRAAIFVLGSNLRFVQGFTADASILTHAFNDKENKIFPQRVGATYNRDDQMDDDAEIARLKKMLENTPGGPGTIEAMRSNLEQIAAAKRRKQMAMTLEALGNIAQYLAGVPGRKNLLWFAETFPVRLSPAPPPETGNPSSPNDPSIAHDAMNQEYEDKIREIGHRMTAAKVAVYPIQAEGVMEEHIVEANLAGPGSTEENLSIKRSKGMAEESDRDTMLPYKKGSRERADTIMAMEQLAQETGGKAFFNRNDLDSAAARAMADGANYYTIGYSPANKKMDGQYRKIDIAAHGNLRLSYRRGYFADSKTDKPPEAKQASDSDPLRPLMKFGLPDATGILYGVKIQPASPQPTPDAAPAGQNRNLTKPATRYDLDFDIRPKDVAFTESSDGTRQAQIEIALLAFDKNGNAVNWNGGTETMNLPPERYENVQKSGIPVHLEIDLPAASEIRLRTGVYDLGNRKSGTLEIPVNVPTTSAQQGSSTSVKQ